MKSIAPVNTLIPGHEDFLEYGSGDSLKDYDIILFNPKIPYYSREQFGGGGSCIGIEGTKTFISSSKHWNDELRDAMKDGKTIFFLLNEVESDLAASGYTSSKNTRTYNTFSIDSYDVLPLNIKPRNASGTKIKVSDSRFNDLYKGLKPYMKYKVHLQEESSKCTFTTKDGSSGLGMIQKYKDLSGHIVFLPYFDLSTLYKTNAKGEEQWTPEGMGAATILKRQMVEIDKILRKKSAATPPPTWVDGSLKPALLTKIMTDISKSEATIKRAEAKKEKLTKDMEDAQLFQSLLYETGTILENAIKETLELLGYEANGFRSGSLEIDHVIISPEKARFIGEAEGKDNTAIDISKFRQLESNIGEDFEREEVAEPAMGILFGNGYRLTDPTMRDTQFTDKCLLNAKRLGTVLIQTTDLYPVAIYLQDNPNDDAFKAKCRAAIESSKGKIVEFPANP